MLYARRPEEGKRREEFSMVVIVEAKLGPYSFARSVAQDHAEIQSCCCERSARVSLD